MTGSHATVRTAREKSGFKAGLRDDTENPSLSVGRKLLGTSTRGPHRARPAPAVAPHDPLRSADACRSAIGRPILLDSSVRYCQTVSDDDGHAWSAPVAIKDAHSVQPSVALMKDGSLVLTGGRPGIFAWINRAGDGRDWLEVDLQSHRNENHPQAGLLQFIQPLR